MAAFGDGFLDADSLVRILVVGNSDDAAVIQNALRAITDGLEFDTCETLQEAERRVRVHDHDVAVLILPLPDAWGADAYAKLRENDRNSEALILLDVADDAASMKGVEHTPFAVLAKSRTTPELLRRLLLSAALYKKACDDGPDALARFEGRRT